MLKRTILFILLSCISVVCIDAQRRWVVTDEDLKVWYKAIIPISPRQRTITLCIGLKRSIYSVITMCILCWNF